MSENVSQLEIKEWLIEVNFVRLLSRCESMASQKLGANTWRLNSFVTHLMEHLSKMKKLSANQPSEEHLLEYTSRVELLKRILEAEKLKTCSLKSEVVDQISRPSFVPTSDTVSTETKLLTRQLHSQIRAQHHDDVRNELFSLRKDNYVRLKNRKENGVDNKIINEEELLKYHQEMQEKLADEMVQMARNLKENASTAGKIVKADNEKLIESNDLAGLNMDQLKMESERLERYLESACNCWMWLSLLIVMVTFVSMCIFMKLFPKKYS